MIFYNSTGFQNFRFSVLNFRA